MRVEMPMMEATMPTSVEALRGQVQGAVLVPGDAGYAMAAQGWNVAVPHAPKMIVEAENAYDVQAAVRYARTKGMPIGVMATGHGMPRSCDGGMMIRTSRMMAVSIDPETRIARIQGGALMRDVIDAAMPYGLSPLSGSSPYVGVVGYLLGGGYNLRIRQYGLGIDMLRSVMIVTAEGDLVRASADENSELFWAVRGGGGAFGVIVEIEMELVPEAVCFMGATIYPAEQAPAIFEAWLAWTKTAPECATTNILFMNLPPMEIIPAPLRGKAVVAVNGCVSGDPAAGEALIAPLRALGTPIIDMWGPLPYTQSHVVFNDPVDPIPAVVRGALIRDFEQSDAEAMLAGMGPIEQMPQLLFQLRHIGGATNRVDEEATPMGRNRGAQYLSYAVSVPCPENPFERIDAHARATFEAIESAILCRGPLNFIGEGSVTPEQVRGVFGSEEYARLRNVKHVYDPENVFRFASVGIE